MAAGLLGGVGLPAGQLRAVAGAASVGVVGTSSITMSVTEGRGKRVKGRRRRSFGFGATF